MYEGDEDDELQRILEGRDEEFEFELDSLTKKTKRDQESGGPARKRKRLVEDEIVPERPDDYDDLTDFIVRHPDDPPDSEDDDKPPGEDEAVEVPVKKPAVKRVVLNPRPKLDPDRLKSQKGLVALMGQNSSIKIKGPGHEAEDLDSLMFFLEHWGHRLFPKLAFDDMIDKLEQLGSKKQVSVFVKKMRQGLPLDVIDDNMNYDEEEEDDVQRGLDLLPNPEPMNAEEAFDRFLADDTTNKENNEVAPVATEPTSLTEEQRQAVARKRLEAIERRKARQALEEGHAQDIQTDADEQQQDICSQELIDMFADAEVTASQE